MPRLGPEDSFREIRVVVLVSCFDEKAAIGTRVLV